MSWVGSNLFQTSLPNRQSTSNHGLSSRKHLHRDVCLFIRWPVTSFVSRILQRPLVLSKRTSKNVHRKDSRRYRCGTYSLSLPSLLAHNPTPMSPNLRPSPNSPSHPPQTHRPLPTRPSLLVQNGVNGDGRLPRLSVPNDQFSLPTADGDQRVDGLEPRGPRGRRSGWSRVRLHQTRTVGVFRFEKGYVGNIYLLKKKKKIKSHEFPKSPIAWWFFSLPNLVLC